MIRLIAAAGLVVALATSAQAITPAPLPQPDGMITQVRFGCGPGRTRVAGVCVARTTIRHTRRALVGRIGEELRKKKPEHFVDERSLSDLHASLERAAWILEQKTAKG